MNKKEEERLNCIKEFSLNIRKEKNIELVAGIDEVGRGPFSGPVVVACVIMPKESHIECVKDSKKLTEKRREEIYTKILDEAVSYGIGVIEPEEIDKINILEATKKALTIAISNMKIKPEHILVDALKDIDTLGIPYTSIIKGDDKIYEISCASIIAKVTRDRMMIEYDEKYPGYGFKKNKGYGTKEHIEAIKKMRYNPYT